MGDKGVKEKRGGVWGQKGDKNTFVTL
jgi:hypothetical protein